MEAMLSFMRNVASEGDYDPCAPAHRLGEHCPSRCSARHSACYPTLPIRLPMARPVCSRPHAHSLFVHSTSMIKSPADSSSPSPGYTFFTVPAMPATHHASHARPSLVCDDVAGRSDHHRGMRQCWGRRRDNLDS
eukprot:1908478-Rhodomonas_salina.2